MDNAHTVCQYKGHVHTVSFQNDTVVLKGRFT